MVSSEKDTHTFCTEPNTKTLDLLHFTANESGTTHPDGRKITAVLCDTEYSTVS